MRPLLFTLVTVGFLGSSSAHACKCLPPPPPKDALKAADAVFSGKVVAIDKDGDFGIKVSIEVAASWKGKLGKTVTVRTANESAACGYGFKRGERYLIYATEDGDGDKRQWHTSTCTRTKSLDEAKAEIEELGGSIGAE